METACCNRGRFATSGIINSMKYSRLTAGLSLILLGSLMPPQVVARGWSGLQSDHLKNDVVAVSSLTCANRLRTKPLATDKNIHHTLAFVNHGDMPPLVVQELQAMQKKSGIGVRQYRGCTLYPVAQKPGQSQLLALTGRIHLRPHFPELLQKLQEDARVRFVMEQPMVAFLGPFIDHDLMQLATALRRDYPQAELEFDTYDDLYLRVRPPLTFMRNP